MAEMNATVIGWANRVGGIWYPSSGVSSLDSPPVNIECVVSCPTLSYSENDGVTQTSNNKYTAIIAVQMPSDSSIRSISGVSITFCASDRDAKKATLYGSLRTLSQSDGSTSRDTVATYRENSIGNESAITGLTNAQTSVTMTFNGSFSAGRTYYLYLYTKDVNSLYTIHYGANNFSAEVVYSVKSYTVTYDANGGIDAPLSQAKEHDGVLMLSSDVPFKADVNSGKYTVTLAVNGGICSTNSLIASKTTSYEFGHWNTSPDGSGTRYASGATYLGNADLYLYAIYLDDTTTDSVVLPTPERAGYSFLGWSADANATSGLFGEYLPEEDITLHAIWGANGLIYIYDGTNYCPFQIFIYDESGWNMYVPYVYDKSSWSMCS